MGVGEYEGGLDALYTHRLRESRESRARVSRLESRVSLSVNLSGVLRLGGELGVERSTRPAIPRAGVVLEPADQRVRDPRISRYMLSRVHGCDRARSKTRMMRREKEIGKGGGGRRPTHRGATVELGRGGEIVIIIVAMIQRGCGLSRCLATPTRTAHPFAVKFPPLFLHPPRSDWT